MSRKKSITFVIPCLNEEATLPIILTKINQVRENSLAGYVTGIIVSDNGSTDNSISIAEKFGARVVHCKERGYGSALKCGIEAAESEYVIFADADDTYDFYESPKLISEIEKGYDMVIGSRLQGNIMDGAMPFLHRHIGTPGLNFIINLLYANAGNKINDCNSGFRCFKKDSFVKWGIKSSGMEFASEMLVKALKNNAKFSHVPISLHKDREGRVPHLRTWRDGMRHLLQILSEAPHFFYKLSISLLLICFVGMIIGVSAGPITLGLFSVFGIHTMLLLLLLDVFALTLFGIGLGLAVNTESNVKLYKNLIEISEDKLFWYSLIVILFSISFFAALFVHWAIHGFSNINLTGETLFVVYLGISGIIFISSVINTHLIKRFKQ